MDVRTRSRRTTAVRVIAILLTYALAGGCNSLGTTSHSFLRHVRTSEDPNVRYQAYQELANDECYRDDEAKDQAVAVLSEKLIQGQEPVASRAVICQTLGALGRPQAREALRRAIEDEAPLVRAEACRALGKVGDAEDIPVLSRIMAADQQQDCRIAAIEGLGSLGVPDPRVEGLLVDGMENEDPAVRLASVRALRALTGQDLGIEPGPWRELVQSQMAAQPAPETTRR